MMKREFALKLGNVEYPVVVEGDTITVNGRPFTVEFADDGMVLVDGIAYDVALEGETATVGGESYEIQVSGLAVTHLAPSPSPSGMAAPRPVEAGAGAVLAIMPGKIVRVMVEAGQEVAEGEPVCVLEAMKMENEVKSPLSGAVVDLRVQPGDTVAAGDTIAIVR
jgi:biotin carboxyl carrier protein